LDAGLHGRDAVSGLKSNREEVEPKTLDISDNLNSGRRIKNRIILRARGERKISDV
jgi:hypothetical protein